MFCISSVDAYGIISVLHNVSNFRQSVSFKACANYDHAKFLVGRHIICFDTHGICFNFKYAISEAIKILSFYAKLIHQNILQCYKKWMKHLIIGESGEGHQRCAPPCGPISFIFVQFSGNNWPNNRLAPPLWSWRLPSGKSCISHCLCMKGF